MMLAARLCIFQAFRTDPEQAESTDCHSIIKATYGSSVFVNLANNRPCYFKRGHDGTPIHVL